MIKFKTGRTYDFEQVLEITLEREAQDDLGLQEITATFVDASRGISGRVQVTVFLDESVGDAVLHAYDAGRYDII
jgi:hypothetical protein